MPRFRRRYISILASIYRYHRTGCGGRVGIRRWWTGIDGRTDKRRSRHVQRGRNWNLVTVCRFLLDLFHIQIAEGRQAVAVSNQYRVFISGWRTGLDPCWREDKPLPDRVGHHHSFGMTGEYLTRPRTTCLERCRKYRGPLRAVRTRWPGSRILRIQPPLRAMKRSFATNRLPGCCDSKGGLR